MDGIGLALGLVLIFLPLLIGTALIIAWIFAIDELIKAAQMKGHHKGSTASLWFIGIFATPIILGLCIAALPDRGELAEAKLSDQNLPDDLPAI